jgi:hypothetical protein
MCLIHTVWLVAQLMAHEENQKYKEGKYILERNKMMDLYEGNFNSSPSEASTVLAPSDLDDAIV